MDNKTNEGTLVLRTYKVLSGVYVTSDAAKTVYEVDQTFEEDSNLQEVKDALATGAIKLFTTPVLKNYKVLKEGVVVEGKEIPVGELVTLDSVTTDTIATLEAGAIELDTTPVSEVADHTHNLNKPEPEFKKYIVVKATTEGDETVGTVIELDANDQSTTDLLTDGSIKDYIVAPAGIVEEPKEVNPEQLYFRSRPVISVREKVISGRAYKEVKTVETTDLLREEEFSELVKPLPKQ